MALTSTKQRQEIGNRLKEERERLGYSEIQIAQLLGIPIDAYIRFEEGLADPGIYRMPRLSSIGFDVLYQLRNGKLHRRLVIEPVLGILLADV